MFLRQNEDLAESKILEEVNSMDRTSTGADSSFKLASFWLKRCIEEHNDCPKPKGFLPTRVLDVLSRDDDGSVKLVNTAELDDADRDLPYVALSHCWGLERF